jgi:hypothetical protein
MHRLSSEHSKIAQTHLLPFPRADMPQPTPLTFRTLLIAVLLFPAHCKYHIRIALLNTCDTDIAITKRLTNKACKVSIDNL